MSQIIYTFWRILVVAVIGLLIGWSIGHNNMWIPVPAILGGIIILLLIRKRTKKVNVDERVFSVADKAAMLVFRAFVLLAGMTAGTMLALDPESHDFKQAGFTLAYSVCVLLLFYLIAYGYYNKKYGG